MAPEIKASKKRCKTCQYWYDDKVSFYGKCRHPLVLKDCRYGYPMSSIIVDWITSMGCGRYKLNRSNSGD